MDYFEIISKYFQRWGSRSRVLPSVAVKNRRKVTQKSARLQETSNLRRMLCHVHKFYRDNRFLVQFTLKPRQPVDFRLSPCSEGSGYGPRDGARRTHRPSSHTHRTLTLNPIGLFRNILAAPRQLDYFKIISK